MRFDPNSYEPVEERLERFWSEHPNGRVEAMLLTPAESLDECVIRAEIYFDITDAHPRGVGHAFEKRGGQGANQTSHLENCETSALGRALANCGYKAKKDSPRPSREEMQKTSGQTQRPQQQQQQSPHEAAPESSGNRSATTPRPASSAPQADAGAMACSRPDCGKPLTKGQHDVSIRAFGQPLCPACQKTQARATA